MKLVSAEKPTDEDRHRRYRLSGSNDLESFICEASIIIIIINRKTENLSEVANKVYTRDSFGSY